MGRRIDPSWGGPIELFLVPASAPQLLSASLNKTFLSLSLLYQRRIDTPPPPPPSSYYITNRPNVPLEDTGSLQTHIITPPPPRWIFWIRHCTHCSWLCTCYMLNTLLPRVCVRIVIIFVYVTHVIFWVVSALSTCFLGNQEGQCVRLHVHRQGRKEGTVLFKDVIIFMCSSVVRAFMVRWVVGSILHGGPIELFLVPTSATRLV